MKTKKILYLALFALMGWTFMGCSSDDEENSSYVNPTTNVDEQVADFLDKSLPISGQSNGFFLTLSKSENACLIINSREELRQAYAGSEELPAIDFSKYTLVIGQHYVAAGMCVKQQYVKNDDTCVLYLYFENYTEAAVAAFVTCNYWGIYPKFSANNMLIKTYWNY